MRRPADGRHDAILSQLRMLIRWFQVARSCSSTRLKLLGPLHSWTTHACTRARVHRPRRASPYPLCLPFESTRGRNRVGSRPFAVCTAALIRSGSRLGRLIERFVCYVHVCVCVCVCVCVLRWTHIPFLHPPSALDLAKRLRGVTRANVSSARPADLSCREPFVDSRRDTRGDCIDRTFVNFGSSIARFIAAHFRPTIDSLIAEVVRRALLPTEIESFSHAFSDI